VTQRDLIHEGRQHAPRGGVVDRDLSAKLRKFTIA
jgi:hypothetical protein